MALLKFLEAIVAAKRPRMAADPSDDLAADRYARFQLVETVDGCQRG
jgi:hypothetical protein